MIPEQTEREALATDDVFARVYDELKGLARGYLRRERPDHTFQPTALVHEAYLRMSGLEPGRWRDRRIFLAVAARAMRRILVDHARRHRLARSWRQTVVLDAGRLSATESTVDLLALDLALERLARARPEHGRVVELHLFGGLSVADTAAVLETSERTIYRQLRSARAWLQSELGIGLAAEEE